MAKQDALFHAALAGLSDAEGHVGLKKSHGLAYARYTLSDRNGQVMRAFLKGLDSRGHNARLYALRDARIQWQLEVSGRSALKLLPEIVFKHREKLVAREIALTWNGSRWREAKSPYAAHRDAVKVERTNLEVIAARRFSLRNDRARRKKEIFRQKVEATFQLFGKGLTVQEVADSLSCSLRTAYRRREKFVFRNVDEGHQWPLP